MSEDNQTDTAIENRLIEAKLDRMRKDMDNLTTGRNTKIKIVCHSKGALLLVVGGKNCVDQLA